MAQSKYDVELQRAANDKRSTKVEKLNGAIRAIGLNNLQTGDVVTIPTGYQVFEQEISGSEQKAQYIVAKVTRDGKETALRFYPSSFMKMGTSVVGNKEEGFKRGEFVHATGTVVDHIQGFGDLNEAVDSLINRPFRVKLTPCNILTFEARDKDNTDLVENDIRKTTMPEYNF